MGKRSVEQEIPYYIFVNKETNEYKAIKALTIAKIAKNA